MQKIVALFLGLTLLMCSCSQSVIDDDIALNDNVHSGNTINNVELLSIQNQIDSLNNQMFPEQVQSRGFKDFFKKIFTVAVSDAVGGMFGALWGGPCGAVAGAIVSSGVAALTPVENISIFSRATDDNGDLQLVMMPMNSKQIALTSSLVPVSETNTKVTKEDSIGYFHNKVLLDLNTSLEARAYTVDNIIDVVSVATADIYNEPKETIITELNSNKSFYEGILSNNIISQPQYTTLHDVFAAWKSQYPEQADKLSVLEVFFNGIVNLDIDENDGQYLEQVLKIVDESSLDEETKRDLRNGFIVGNASYQLWNVQE